MTLSEKSNVLASVSKVVNNGEVFNTANIFTALRVLLVPPIILLLLYRPRLPYNVSVDIIAGLIFIAAALTDKADGYYARKYNNITRVGQFFDPLADKLLMIPVMVTLWYLGMLPMWVVLVVVVREAAISVIRVIGARRSITFPASWSGKVKMFSQVVVVSVLIFFPGSGSDIIVRVLVYIMAAITTYSGIDYLVRARREIFHRAPVSAEGE